jgi:hypothetical protein
MSKRCTPIKVLFISTAVLATFACTASAQQVRGTPGSPSTVEFPDSRVLPLPTPPFTGTIMPNAIDSTSAWPPQTMPPENAPNILLILTDDVGFGAPSTFGGVIPTPASIASRRTDFATPPSTRQLADTSGTADGSQPSLSRLRQYLRNVERLPRL